MKGGGTTGYTRDNQGTLYYLFDGLGSTVALTDSTGAVKNTYAYDPYGKVTASTGSVANPYRFGGAYGAYTDSSGLVKIGERYYDPALGRWLQQDPLAIGGSLPIGGALPRNASAGCSMDPTNGHRYAYVGGNPINSSDPSGLITCRGTVQTVCELGYTGFGVGACALLAPETFGVSCAVLIYLIQRYSCPTVANMVCGKGS